MSYKYSNQGFKQSIANNSVNEIKWDATYDGKNGYIELDLNNNGAHKKYSKQFIANPTELNKAITSFEKIVNVPSINTLLDKRLMQIKHNSPEMKQIVYWPDKQDLVIEEIVITPKSRKTRKASTRKRKTKTKKHY
jgi:hypothetical protein